MCAFVRCHLCLSKSSEQVPRVATYGTTDLFVVLPPRSRPRSSSKKEKKKRKEEDSLIGDLSEGLRCRDFFEGSVIRAGITGRLAMGSSTLQMQPLPDSNTSREKYNLNTVLRFSRGYFQVFNEVARLTFVYLVKSSKLSLSLSLL